MNESTVSQSSTNPNIEVVYEEPIDVLDYNAFYNNQEIVKKLNEVIREINRLKQ